MLRINAEDIERLYTPLHSIGNLGDTPGAGFLRAAWSAEESRAIQHIIEQGQRIGLKVRSDAVGNAFLEIAGTEAGFLEAGSHLDTVVLGGNYDGAAGVVAGLAAIEKLLQLEPRPRYGLRLRIWRGEESATYGTLCKGSQAAFGRLQPDALERIFRGKTLRQAILEAGFDPQPIEKQLPTITQQEVDSVVAHLELHIEQATTLERGRIDIGIVNSIRAPHRLHVELEGSFDHSGATPMGTEYRHDANLALGYILVALDRLQQDEISAGHDLVQTVGIVNSDRAFNEENPKVYQNAVAKVSGFCYFTLDIRSNDAAFRDAYVEKVKAAISKVAEPLGVAVRIATLSASTPVPVLDTGLQGVLIESTARLGYTHLVMPSGAVHDAVFVAQAKKKNGNPIPVGMIFIPCRKGISHSPEEFASHEAIAKGASVTATAFEALMRT